MSHRLSTGLAAILMVGSCGGNAAPEGPVPGDVADVTAWDRVLDGMTDESVVPLDTALQAFALAIGPLPGVEAPEGQRKPIPSGSGAVRWLLGRWDELTAEQQGTVT
ncbi:MAG: hypothetical protein ACRDZM_19010, partial [Acidimicrobiia bacterium]